MDVMTYFNGGAAMSNRGDFIAGMVVGGFLGAMVGVLYAPKSGRETREEIGRKTDELLSKAKEEYEAAVEKSRSAYESALAKLKKLEEQTQQRVEEVGQKVDDLKEQGKETLQDNTSRLKHAIAVGVEAFKEEQKKA
jgi:gas vesicle protein